MVQLRQGDAGGWATSTGKYKCGFALPLTAITGVRHFSRFSRSGFHRQLPGGAKAIYNSTGLAYNRHTDWLGSSRLTSTQSRGLYSGTAYAPFGEQYATSGTADASFTGQDQDTASSLYDFLARRQSPSQGRWISPDPAGRAAVKLANPQSWNRYAYVLNNPLRLIDSTGLDSCGGAWRR